MILIGQHFQKNYSIIHNVYSGKWDSHLKTEVLHLLGIGTL